MKLIHKEIIIGAILSFCIAAFGCKKEFLNVLPSGVLQDEQMITADGVREALIGAYSDLDGQYDPTAIQVWVEPDNWVTGSVAGGDAHKGSDPADGTAGAPRVGRMEGLPTDDFFNNKWTWLYDGIARSNLVMRLVARVPNMEQSEKENINAQAQFLRGFYAFCAKRTWNNVPWVDSSVTYSAGNYQIPNDQDIFPLIENDFKTAFDNLPETQDAIGRANKWIAGAFLAKTYMFEKKFDQALPLLMDIINNGVNPLGVKFDLNPRFSMNFDFEYKNGPESVFAIQASINDGAQSFHGNVFDLLNYPYGGGAVTGCCGFFQPSIELVNSFRTNNDGLPLLDGSLTNPEYNSSQNAVKNDQGVSSTSAFTPDAGPLDPRLDWTVGRRGIPYLDWGLHPGQSWIRNQASAGPFSPKKNVFYKSQIGTGGDNAQTQWAPTNAINYNVIRYAQILLWAAECEVEIGTLDNAQSLVNLIRKRAANSSDFVMNGNQPAANYVISEYPVNWFMSHGKDYARNAVHFEEKLELAMEGHRFYDLVRWGEANEVLNYYFQFESQFTGDVVGAKFTDPKNQYYPIPQIQIDLSNQTLTQNVGYR